ncbi:hypothetical protein TcG_02683 [Trypanosoma cruzi]|nr:hypothetical protein TcG_02683 [Trypanosoma cruzi]
MKDAGYFHICYCIYLTPLSEMEVSCSIADKPQTFDYFTERYYHQYVVRNCKGVEDNNCRLLVHSNGLCVLCVDGSHAAIQSHRKGLCTDEELDASHPRIESVTFGSGRGNAKLAPQNVCLLGNRKKNATKCQEDTNICVITMTDGTLYKIPACVAGFVLELNPAVQERPELLATAPHVEGFIAVISPNYNKLDLGKYQKVWEATGGDIVDDNDADDCTKKYEP